MGSLMSVERSRIALVHPDTSGNYVSNNLHRENLGIGYLSAVLKRSGFDVEIFDARLNRMTTDRTAEEILDYGPGIVGVSLILKEASGWTELVSKKIKDESEGEIHVAVGNYFPSLQPEEALDIMPSIDSVVLGEGEETFLDLIIKISQSQEWRGLAGTVSRKDKGFLYGERRKLIKKLDSLPFPTRYASEEQILELAVEGSRGCSSRCTFCAVGPHFDPKKSSWRSRSAESITSEIKQLRKNYPNIYSYRFVDPDFIGEAGNLERLVQIANKMAEVPGGVQFFIDAKPDVVVNIPEEIWIKLKNSGLKQVYIGVETGSEMIKKKMAKKSTTDDDKRAIDILSHLGIDVQYGFMMITPWTTEDTLLDSVHVLNGLGYPRLDKYFQEMNLVPKTKALELIRRQGVVFPDGESGYFSYDVPEDIDRLRLVSRRFVERYAGFLERFDFAHKQVMAIGLREQSIGRELQDLNLEVFLTILGIAKIINISDDSLNTDLLSVVKKFEPKIKNIEERLAI